MPTCERKVRGRELGRDRLRCRNARRRPLPVNRRARRVGSSRLPSDNPIDAAIWPRLVGDTRRSQRSPRFIRRPMSPDFLGRVPSDADIGALLWHDADAMERSFMNTPEFILRQAQARDPAPGPNSRAGVRRSLPRARRNSWMHLWRNPRIRRLCDSGERAPGLRDQPRDRQFFRPLGGQRPRPRAMPTRRTCSRRPGAARR